MCTFAVVKRLNSHISVIMIAAFLTIAAIFSGSNAKAQPLSNDSLEVSLLTCQPNQHIYGLYGHTALRLHDLQTGADWSFNYGVFNFEKPFFVLRFLFGLTDYELGAVPMDIFCDEYKRMGCQVTEQIINLTSEEKSKLLYSINENYKPENRIYRYNYFYDNCTTRARDILENAIIDGRIEYSTEHQVDSQKKSYRQMIHEHTILHPWAAVGNDLCLGVKADMSTTWREQQFLPYNLMNDFDKALIVSTNGQQRPLVSKKRILLQGRPQTIVSEFPLTPLQCSLCLLIITVIITIAEIKKHKSIIIYDVILMSIQGLVGIIITAMLFSEHPTTSTNLQALILNPLPLFFIYQVARRRATNYWHIAVILTVICLIGGFIQDYAEGIIIVALCLLIRELMHLFVFPKLGILDYNKTSLTSKKQKNNEI